MGNSIFAPKLDLIFTKLQKLPAQCYLLWLILRVKPVALVLCFSFSTVDCVSLSEWQDDLGFSEASQCCASLYAVGQWVNGDSQCLCVFVYVCVFYPRDNSVTYFYNGPVVTQSWAVVTLFNTSF